MADSIPATELAAGPLLAGRYACLRELGRGGSGRVLLVADTAAGGTRRAAKIVPPDEARRLRWEFDLLHGIAHPGLAAVHELLRLDHDLGGAFRLERGVSVLIEDYAEGEGAGQLAERLRDDPEALVRWAVVLARCIAGALSAIHAAGLVHGDVKPDNLVVGEDPAGARLIDLGLSRPPGSESRVSGTPGFLAPEAWQGERSVAVDLYGLGATLHQLLGGRSATFETQSRSLRDLVGRALAEPRQATTLPPAVPPPLRRLVATLLEIDPASRPASAREVVARLAAVGADMGIAGADLGGGADTQPAPRERAMALGSLPLVGAEREVKALTHALSVGGVIQVVGPPGCGRSRLVREAVRRHQLARAATAEPVPTWVQVSGQLPALLPPDSLLVVEDADSITLEEVESARRATQLLAGTLTVVLERTRPLPGASASIEIRPLTREGVAALLSAAFGQSSRSGASDRPSAALLDAAMAVCGGLPGRLCRLLADAVSDGEDPPRPAALRALGGAELGEGVDVPRRARRVAELLAVAGGALDASQVEGRVGPGELGIAMSAMVGAGVAYLSGGGEVRLRPDVARALWADLSESRRREIARSLSGLATTDAALGFVAAATGDMERADREFARAVARHAAAGDPEATIALARRAGDMLGGRLSPAMCIGLADALRARGRYQEAFDTLTGVDAAEGLLLRAELDRLLGRPADARATAEGVRTAASSPVLRGLASAVVARCLLDEGHARRCMELGEAALGAVTTVDVVAEARTAEVAALGALYAGESVAAAELCQRALDAARRASAPALEARARTVSALLSAERGEIRAAAMHHARAFELADAAGELHGAASSLANLGLIRLDAGEPGPAIAALREGARRLARLGRDRDLCRVLYNLGLAAVLVGDDDLAGSAVRQGRDAAVRCGDVSAEAYARILEAEMALRAGALSNARTAAEAASEAVSSSSPRDRAVVSSRRAMLLASLGDRRGAEAQLLLATAAASEDGTDAARVEERLAVARVALLAGKLSLASAAATVAQAMAERVGTYEARLRASLIAADAAEARGDRQASTRSLATARTLLDAASATLESGARARLRRVVAYQRALSAAPTDARTERDDGDGRWRRLAFFARRLTAERRVARLYEEILDAAVELSGAERGFLVLRDQEGALRIRVARGMERRDLSAEDLRYSRSIAARAVDGGRIVSSVDALADDRLDGAASVHALALRSVVAVPLRRRGDVAGAIYLDDRLRPAAFGPQDEALLGDLADLASIALDGAELLRAERKQARRLSTLQRRLARTVETQAIEIASLKRATGDPRSSFPGIIAHSEAMQQTLSLAERVAASDVPVLILGESGTGKELVARAIHDRSVRQGAAFVSENCGAIPESLLESALFGHVRGAFTGADRSRPGLFDAADGGTLFLDEIGEMSHGMQTKLLRAVQDGEIRPVGSDRTRRVDVRIVAATHRDLDEMVRTGAFREDLFYRLAVVQLKIPPLRERPEDVGPLVAHLLDKHRGDRTVRVDRKALALMSSFSWPGNVRQLENEVQRALVMGADVISAEHLSPVLRSDGSDEAPEELDLKGQTQVLERRLIRRALDRTGGNQTRAAKLLGVSRYGLQKMMKRLGLPR